MVQLIQNGNNTACCFEVVNDGAAIGIIEWKAFWDGMPYLSLLKIHKRYRGKGLGRQALTLLEGQLKNQGNKALLTSTRADEQAQHFYRALGYKECGCLVLDNTPLSQPIEIFFIKTL